MLNLDNLNKAIKDSVNETATSFFMEDMGITNGPVIVCGKGQEYVPPEADITAIINFSGVMFGASHLSSPIHVAKALSSAFMGEPIKEAGEMLTDAFGELSNIISGAVKSHISEEIELSPPTIFNGTEVDTEYSNKLESTRCHFNSKAGPFVVEVFYHHHADKNVNEFKA
jgi:chemotaxis protein CheX